MLKKTRIKIRIAALSGVALIMAVGFSFWLSRSGSEAPARQQPITGKHLSLPEAQKFDASPESGSPASREAASNPVDNIKSDPDLQRLESLVRENSPTSLLAAAKVLGECVANEMLARKSGSASPQPFCKNVNPLYFRQRRQWIEAAMANHVPGAGTEWVRQGPNGSMIDYYQRPDDPLVMEWARRSLEILNAEAKRGDIEAIGALGAAYSKMGIGGFDAIKMHAYQRVLWEIKYPENAGEYIKTLESSSRLTPEEAKAANEIANKLIKEIRDLKE